MSEWTCTEITQAGENHLKSRLKTWDANDQAICVNESLQRRDGNFHSLLLSVLLEFLESRFQYQALYSTDSKAFLKLLEYFRLM
mmetsp:Transcript_7522/g.22852  ORF Transcript_7522/g.22852 Transcript_7522/m.22852 type:complete len:84 (+) Transcript_7522:2627-2878(+)